MRSSEDVPHIQQSPGTVVELYHSGPFSLPTKSTVPNEKKNKKKKEKKNKKKKKKKKKQKEKIKEKQMKIRYTYLR